MVSKRKTKGEPIKVTIYCHPHQYPTHLEDLEHKARTLMTEAGATNITDMRYRIEQATLTDDRALLGIEFAARATRVDC